MGIKFRDIPQFIFANSSYDIWWTDIEAWIAQQQEECRLELYPDFQRGHVWTKEQQTKYIEFCLSGGRSGRELMFNYPRWQQESRSDMPMYCVDGLQRITAVRCFLLDAIPAFGHKYSEFEDKLKGYTQTFHVNMNELQTRKEVIEWYLQLNDGGTVHSISEIARVRNLLMQEMG